MSPIHQLLSRIRWDRGGGSADFEKGYYARVLARFIRVQFTALILPPDDHYAILAMDLEGASHSVPLHRIREVEKAGQA